MVSGLNSTNPSFGNKYLLTGANAHESQCFGKIRKTAYERSSNCLVFKWGKDLAVVAGDDYTKLRKGTGIGHLSIWDQQNRLGNKIGINVDFVQQFMADATKVPMPEIPLEDFQKGNAGETLLTKLKINPLPNDDIEIRNLDFTA